LLDQVGLDVVAHVAGVLTAAFGDRAPRPSVPQALKEKGWLGRKSGRGFYLYRAGTRGESDAGAPAAPSEVHTAAYGPGGGGGRRGGRGGRRDGWARGGGAGSICPARVPGGSRAGVRPPRRARSTPPSTASSAAAGGAAATRPPPRRASCCR